MSSCNYCTLQRMHQRAKTRGVKVIIESGRGEMPGWTAARYSDKKKPSAYFMELPGHCAC